MQMIWWDSASFSINLPTRAAVWPEIVSSACSELPSAFDQVNEFSR